MLSPSSAGVGIVYQRTYVFARASILLPMNASSTTRASVAGTVKFSALKGLTGAREIFPKLRAAFWFELPAGHQVFVCVVPLLNAPPSYDSGAPWVRHKAWSKKDITMRPCPRLLGLARGYAEHWKRLDGA